MVAYERDLILRMLCSNSVNELNCSFLLFRDSLLSGIFMALTGLLFILGCAVKTNDMMLVIYLSSLIRSVVALHNLINNKV